MVTELRKLVLKTLAEYGESFRGSVLHVGSAEDPYKYKRFFLGAVRYRTLDKMGQVNPDIIANIQNMPEIPSDSEDCIIATFFLYQVPDIEAALREFKRVLKPRGILFTTFTHRMGGCRVHTFTKEEALKLMGALFKIEAIHQRDVGTLIVGINDEDDLV